MSFKALYREWRPDRFEELIGQEHVTTTLKNSILKNRIAHAYLFCGPRGTGKTSTAKLLAKGLNCKEGPTENPCGVCKSCKSMDEGRFFDVIEIDAASNRGINEIREIRDQVVYPPSEGFYKVYIIDEVHMLTQEAFNALLKTLEEPPPYIIFVLATTEPHKLPMTILSRCQRFDFHRISVKDITDRLERVLKDNNITYETKALFTIARNAEGGMRDALSLLDQCLSYTESELKDEHVLGIIGSVDEDIFYKLIKAIVDTDVITTLLIVKEVMGQGKDINQFFKDLMNYFRDLLLVNMGSKDEELIKGEYDNLVELSKHFEKHELIEIIDFISEKQKELIWSQNQRLILEMTLFRLINRDKIFSELNDKINVLEDKIEKLEKGLTTVEKNEILQKDIQRDENRQQQMVQKAQTTKRAKMSQIGLENEGKKDETEATKESTENNGEPESILKISLKWADILEALKKEKIYAHAYLLEGKPVEIKNKTLYIGFSPQHNIHMERVSKKENKDAIEKVLGTWFPGIKVNFKLISEEAEKKNDTEDREEENLKVLAKENEKDIEKIIVDFARKEFGENKVEVFKNK